MSVKQYMHPRNIYRTPPSFKELALEFPEFRKHVTQDVTGKISLDFKNPEALRALTCTLLKKDFNLNVDIPLNKMIPTIPLRLNYILWIEDLLNISGKNSEIKGIDIGTGASCIYCLLGAKKGWYMIGTDINDSSISCAINNVTKNNLQHLIKVKKVDSNSLLKDVVIDENIEQYDFCMCNPPFFSNTNELSPNFKSRRPDRPKPKNAFCATTNEVVCLGGEVDFVKKIIQESRELQMKIRIYTTMLGHKSSLPELKSFLRQCQVKCFKETEFCQGNTTRWGLAWTYTDIDLRKIPKDTLAVSKKFKAKPVYFSVESKELSYENFCEKICNIFEDLEIKIEETASTKSKRAFYFSTFKNTWSNQRQKRRQKEILTKLLNITTEIVDKKSNLDVSSDDKSVNDDSLDDKNECEVQNTTNLIRNISVSSPQNSSKRELDSSEENICKKSKIDTSEDETYLLKGIAKIYKEKTNLLLEMTFLDGKAGKEGVHQILQYIKNNWNK